MAGIKNNCRALYATVTKPLHPCFVTVTSTFPRPCISVAERLHFVRRSFSVDYNALSGWLVIQRGNISLSPAFLCSYKGRRGEMFTVWPRVAARSPWVFVMRLFACKGLGMRAPSSRHSYKSACTNPGEGYRIFKPLLQTEGSILLMSPLMFINATIMQWLESFNHFRGLERIPRNCSVILCPCVSKRK